jgi:hypothetical protein
MFLLRGTPLFARESEASGGKTYVRVYVEVPGRKSLVECYYDLAALNGALPVIGQLHEFDVTVSARIDRISGGAELSVRADAFALAGSSLSAVA